MQLGKRLAATFHSLWQALRNTWFFSLALWTKDWGINAVYGEGLLGLSAVIYCATHNWILYDMCEKMHLYRWTSFDLVRISEDTCPTGCCFSTLLPNSSFWSISRPLNVLLQWPFVFKQSSIRLFTLWHQEAKMTPNKKFTWEVWTVFVVVYPPLLF